LEVLGDKFPKLPFHQIVCIGAVFIESAKSRSPPAAIRVCGRTSDGNGILRLSRKCFFSVRFPSWQPFVADAARRALADPRPWRRRSVVDGVRRWSMYVLTWWSLRLPGTDGSLWNFQAQCFAVLRLIWTSYRVDRFDQIDLVSKPDG
jgi:hypothetical protein